MLFVISEDVKSLALPGTYHEKVVSLGSSLRKFSRLKHLDLSRNNISSLQVRLNIFLLKKTQKRFWYFINWAVEPQRLR